MNLSVRPITESEVEIFRTKMSHAFGDDPREGDSLDRLLQTLDLQRTVAAFDGADLIGTSGAFSFDLTVPGNTLPMAGTTVVTVQPTHRRRGVLRAMMQAHLEEVCSRNEPLAGLWASEASIYGRFGYGLAAEGHLVNVDGKSIQFTDDSPDGSVTLMERADAEPLMREIYETCRPTRPGILSRSDAWWNWRVFHDPEHRRDGKSAKRFAIYRKDGDPQGYSVYRQKQKWGKFPEGEIHIVEVFAATPDAHHGLWRYLTNIDLFPSVTYWNAPVDDELPWRITELRRIRRTVDDTLWIRVLDIPRAVSSRAYREPGRLVFSVNDPFIAANNGTYELNADASGAECSPSSDDADIELPIDALGAIYLGRSCVATLARAGIVRGSAEAIARTDRMFAWSLQPWCPEVF